MITQGLAAAGIMVNMHHEIALLREVYEAARAVLRYDGVDARRVKDALLEMDAAIEKVKALDSGYGDDCPACGGYGDGANACSCSRDQP